LDQRNGGFRSQLSILQLSLEFSGYTVLIFAECYAKRLATIASRKVCQNGRRCQQNSYLLRTGGLILPSKRDDE